MKRWFEALDETNLVMYEMSGLWMELRSEILPSVLYIRFPFSRGMP